MRSGLVSRLCLTVRRWLARWPGSGLLEPGESLVGDGFVIEYYTGFMPHGRSIVARLRCLDGLHAALLVKSKPRYDQPHDVEYERTLFGNALAEAHALLRQAARFEERNQCMDGWRTRITGIDRSGTWVKRHVIAGREGGDGLVACLERVNAFLLSEAR